MTCCGIKVEITHTRITMPAIPLAAPIATIFCPWSPVRPAAAWPIAQRLLVSAHNLAIYGGAGGMVFVEVPLDDPEVP